MRTTLDIDEDVLEAVKERAAAEKKTAGAVLSELARQAILGPEIHGPEPVPGASGGFGEVPQKMIMESWPTFPLAAGQPRRIITNAHVQRVQDEIDREDVEEANRLARGERN